MATPPTPNKCPNCKKSFAQKSGLGKHLREGRCSIVNASPIGSSSVVPDHLALIKGDVHFSNSLVHILHNITGKNERFVTCQTMGVYLEGFYPLVFRIERAKAFQGLGHFSTNEESSSLLLEILRENPGQPLFLKKNLKR